MDNPQIIREWYQAVKRQCTCPVCEREGLNVEAGKVEFHHIDPSTKRDSISGMVYKNLVHPQPYAAVKVAVEFGKVLPLCPDHHKGFHDNKIQLDTQNDPFIRDRLEGFRRTVLDTLPLHFKGSVVSLLPIQRA